MKRSEMCKKIKEFINKIYTVENIESMEELYLASMLLSEIELEGTLKPVEEVEQNDGKVMLLFGWESEFKKPCLEKLKEAQATLKDIIEREPEDE